MNKRPLAAAVIVILSIGSYTVFGQTPAPNMSFFVTSSNPKGVAISAVWPARTRYVSPWPVGAGGKTWHAYLSTSTVEKSKPLPHMSANTFAQLQKLRHLPISLLDH
jgi:hypothetical protein